MVYPILSSLLFLKLISSLCSAFFEVGSIFYDINFEMPPWIVVSFSACVWKVSGVNEHSKRKPQREFIFVLRIKNNTHYASRYSTWFSSWDPELCAIHFSRETTWTPQQLLVIHANGLINREWNLILLKVANNPPFHFVRRTPSFKAPNPKLARTNDLK